MQTDMKVLYILLDFQGLESIKFNHYIKINGFFLFCF